MNTISIFDLFSIGVGPSSSHTVGPMRAAKQFVDDVIAQKLLKKVAHVQVDLYGSLALTGRGHGTDWAVLMGLEGQQPEAIDPDIIQPRFQAILYDKNIHFNGDHVIDFDSQTDLNFHYDEFLPAHANALRLTVHDQQQQPIYSQVYYSIGGGFILDEQQMQAPVDEIKQETDVPFPFTSAKTLLQYCEREQCSIADIMLANEKTWRSEQQIKEGLLNIWSVMKGAIERGCQQTGVLPGGINVPRRAKSLYDKLTAPSDKASLPVRDSDWLNLYALAVNEENAAGARVVTAPTNGAAGLIPSVIQYYLNFCEGASEQGLLTLMLTAGAIGILYKESASISAAEVGCQGEVGVACSMAAGGIAAALGGSVAQVENAAEIGMEHFLGLTCDPVAGLVQIPCIERNAMGAVAAVNAAHLALRGEGSHIISLDQVIDTMYRTGKAMSSDYKETSRGGLAYPVNIPEC